MHPFDRPDLENNLINMHSGALIKVEETNKSRIFCTRLLWVFISGFLKRCSTVLEDADSLASSWPYKALKGLSRALIKGLMRALRTSLGPKGSYMALKSFLKSLRAL
jgi:hypothetical protein